MRLVVDPAAVPTVDLDPLSLVLHASGPVAAVLGLLVAAAVGAWAITVIKHRQLGRWITAQRELDAALLADRGEGLAAIARRHPDAPGAPVLLALAAREGEDDVLAAVAARAMVDVHHRLSTFMPTLASIGSSSPFVGLFGTVYGIMDAFLRIGREKSATLPVVAPAIGEALIATAVGLFAAIPAVIAYNALIKRLDDLHAEVDAASREWVIVAARPTVTMVDDDPGEA
ncbi:MAG: MotA/TolQ/ExbB proton channel family protein [Nannocystaceae bacterium]